MSTHSVEPVVTRVKIEERILVDQRLRTLVRDAHKNALIDGADIGSVGAALRDPHALEVVMSGEPLIVVRRRSLPRIPNYYLLGTDHTDLDILTFESVSKAKAYDMFDKAPSKVVFIPLNVTLAEPEAPMVMHFGGSPFPDQNWIEWMGLTVSQVGNRMARVTQSVQKVSFERVNGAVVTLRAQVGGNGNGTGHVKAGILETNLRVAATV